MSTIVEEDPPVTTTSLPPVKTLYKVYPLSSYKTPPKFKEYGYEEYTLEDLTTRLQTQDRGYHVCIHKKGIYNFFGDLDNYQKTFPEFAKILVFFLKGHYKIKINEGDISHTANQGKPGSFHYSIPSIHCSCELLKEIHENLRKAYPDHFFHNGKKVVDTTIYSEHYFRLPMQSKESVAGTMHLVVSGDLKNFIPEYIPRDSVSVEHKSFRKKITLTKEAFNTTVKAKRTASYSVLYKLFDTCYKKERFTDRSDWISVGMALMNEYSDAGFEVFDYFSSKGSNYGGTEVTRKIYNSFKKEANNGYRIATVYYYAREDNPTLYEEIICADNPPEFDDIECALKIKELAGDRFIYIKNGDDYVLYSYTNNRWERDEQSMRKYICTELHSYILNQVDSIYGGTQVYPKIRNSLRFMKRIIGIKTIVEAYKMCGRANIRFDSKKHLLGFNNGVYDLHACQFREYQYSDYVTMTTGYEYIPPSEESVNKIKSLIDMIMPIPEERQVYMDIMSTSLDGQMLEQFYILNGSGGNAKSFMTDIVLLALGEYGIVASNAILTEPSRTGCCPERANMHKKRLIVFREPSESTRLQNSTIKELTGSDTFNARNLHSKDTIKDMYGTLILETNKKPLLAEAPLEADARRIIDMPFRATFTQKSEYWNDSEYIYKADLSLKTDEFRMAHRCAIMKVLMDAHLSFKARGFTYNLPDSLEQRRIDYLDASCDLIVWFRDCYVLSSNPKDSIKLKDVYRTFKDSDFYINCTKKEKKIYKYKWFCAYMQKSLFLRKYVTDNGHDTLVIKGWTTDYSE